MKHVRHIIISGLVALFALGSLVHAAKATTMAIDMAMADVQADDTGSCQACLDNDTATQLCDLVCLMTFVALPTSVPTKPMTVHIAFDGAPDLNLPGRFGTLDPNPPRYFIQD